ncbi:MAG: hypothetical protein FWD11_00235, partial [Micrococcales bacterium]|nr:hypothetical protein [Micrococcales bacterium]
GEFSVEAVPTGGNSTPSVSTLFPRSPLISVSPEDLCDYDGFVSSLSAHRSLVRQKLDIEEKWADFEASQQAIALKMAEAENFVARLGAVTISIVTVGSVVGGVVLLLTGGHVAVGTVVMFPGLVLAAGRAFAMVSGRRIRGESSDVGPGPG